MPLAWAPTPEELSSYVASGLVSARSHDGLTIYNYTPRCQYQRAWDAVTLAARGLLYTDAGELIARPFPKFFNHDEPDARLPDGPPDAVAWKYDGALGISYHWRGRNRWTTRGSLTSPQGAVAQRLWHELGGGACPNADAPLDGWTLLVEIVGPSTKQIVDHPREGLVLLGARRVHAGRYATQAELGDLAGRWGLSVAEEVPVRSAAALASAASRLPATAEGWVARWGDHRIKFKGSAYKEMARRIAGLNPRRYADHWYANDQAALWRVPEEFRTAYEEVAAELEASVAALAARVRQAVARCEGLDDAQAVAALRASDDAQWLGPVMQARRGRDADLRRIVYVQRFGRRPRPVDR